MGIFAAGSPVRLEPRLNELDSLITSFKQLAVTPEMPLRPGFGTAGTPITLRSNFFALRLPKALQIYEYAVKISPKGADLSGPCKARILELIETSSEIAPHMAYIAHDRSGRLVSAKLLPQPLQLSVRFFEREEGTARPNAKVYTVKIEFTGDLNTDELVP